MLRLGIIFSILTLVLGLSTLTYAQGAPNVQNWTAQPGYGNSIQQQLNTLTNKVNSIVSGSLPACTPAQMIIENVSGTAFACITMSGDCTIALNGVITCPNFNGTPFGTLAGLGVGTGLTSSGGNLNLTTPVTVANGGTQCAGPSVFSSLPPAPTQGEICVVTNAPACTAGTPVTAGGGSAVCQVMWDGANWQPAGAALSAAASGVTNVSASAPITSTGGATPNIALTTPLSVSNGGMGGNQAGLAAGFIAIGQSGTVYAPKALSGDCTIISTGAITCTASSGNLFTSLAFGEGINLSVPLPIGNTTPNSGAFSSLKDTAMTGGPKVVVETSGVLSASSGSGITNSTVAGLPTCNAGAIDLTVDVTDCTTCTFGGTCVGSGSTFCREVCTGASGTWIAQ